MTQPSFAPIALDDEVRPAYRLDPPAPWRASRPGELRPGAERLVRGGGVPGPDQGYALRLAARFRDRLVLTEGEHADDVIAGALAVALRRAAVYGRAPVSSDLELALSVFGYLAAAPEDLVQHRRRLFAGVAHDYTRQRAVASALPETTLRLTPRAVQAGDWRRLVEVSTA
jgi:hypothetical protein